jgi:WD40 repeat protein
MITKSHSIDFKERCLSVDFSSKDDLFSISTGRTLNLFPKEYAKNYSGAINPLYVIYSHNDIIQGKFSPDGNNFGICDMNQEIIIYDLKSKCNQIYKSDKQLCKTWKFTFSPDNKTFTHGAYNLSNVNYLENKVISNSNYEKYYFYSIEYINDNLIAAGNINGSVYIFSTNDFKKVHKIEDHCKAVRTILYNKESSRLFTASDDMHINVIDSGNYKVLFPLVSHKDSITCLKFITDKNLLVSGSLDGKIKLWDIRSAKEVESVHVKNEIWDLSISNDNKSIIVGTEKTCDFYSIN